MNIQVCVPYEKCPFKCPMCIAVKRTSFENVFEKDRELYKKRLDNVLSKNNYNDIVISGSTEPTLNRNWLNYILSELKNNNGDIELQTKNYHLKNYNLKGLNTLAYSITNLREYLSSWNFRKIEGNNRLVILLTKEFEFLNSFNFNTFGFNQITFRVLQETADEKTNEWIRANQMTDFSGIYEIIEHYNGSETSVRIDTDCQDSEKRHYIFRENGKLYPNWDTEIEIKL